MTKELFFSIADTVEPLDKEEQLKQWLIFKSGLDVLENFYHTLDPATQKDCYDPHFKYFTKKLIDLCKSKANSKDKAVISKAIKTKDTLIFTNMRMIISRANAFKQEDIDLSFLINEAILGSIRALVKFVPSSLDKKKKTLQLSILEPYKEEVVRVYKVSSYMRTWIDCYLRLAVSKQKDLIDQTNKKKERITYVELTPTTNIPSYQETSGDLLDYFDLHQLTKEGISYLEVINSDLIELALDYNLTLQQATDIKNKVVSELKDCFL